MGIFRKKKKSKPMKNQRMMPEVLNLNVKIMYDGQLCDAAYMGYGPIAYLLIVRSRCKNGNRV